MGNNNNQSKNKINDEINKHLSEKQQLQQCMCILATCKVNETRNDNNRKK